MENSNKKNWGKIGAIATIICALIALIAYLVPFPFGTSSDESETPTVQTNTNTNVINNVVTQPSAEESVSVNTTEMPPAPEQASTIAVGESDRFFVAHWFSPDDGLHLTGYFVMDDNWDFKDTGLKFVNGFRDEDKSIPGFTYLYHGMVVDNDRHDTSGNAHAVWLDSGLELYAFYEGTYENDKEVNGICRYYRDISVTAPNDGEPITLENIDFIGDIVFTMQYADGVAQRID